MNEEKLSLFKVKAEEKLTIKTKLKSIKISDKLSDIKNGGLTGLITIIIIQPFQVIKTSMIILNNKQKNIRMRDIVKKINTEEGPFGFYRGFLPSFLKATFGYAIFFSSLEFNKKLLNKLYNNNNNNNILKYNYILNFLASGISRSIQVLAVNPLNIIKTRNEVLGFNSYKNIKDAILKIKKEEGYKGFYSGLKTTLIKDIPASGMFYMCYEIIKKDIKSLGIENVQIQAILSSSLTSLFLVLLTNPLEIIRTRQQYQHFSTNKDHIYSSVFHGFLRIYKNESLSGFFVGVIPRLMKKGLGSIIVWTTYESLRLKKEKL
jgi:solute carrier family 25 protein 38